MLKKYLLVFGISGVIAALMLACPSPKDLTTIDETNVVKAIAVLQPTEGNSARGIVTFTKEATGMKIVADVEGLTPGKHGFHIHEFGDISAPDASSAGGHFNPNNTKHGAPADFKRHAGDLGNLEANEDGKAHYERIDVHPTFVGSHNILGRAVIIHQNEDDFETQPTGNAGPRIACGVIGIAEVLEEER
jgi:Cu-Zn family superoxide dismutase